MKIDLLELFNVIYEEQSGDYWTMTAGGIITLLGLVFLVFSLIDMGKYSKKTRGTLLRSEPTYKTKRGIEEQYLNTYNYEVDGKKYKLEAKENSRHDQGYEKTIYYSRKDPKEARTNNSKTTLKIGAIALILGLLAMYRGLMIAKELLNK